MYKIYFKKIIYLALLTLIAFAALKPSFLLGFMGDDWLAFYRYKYHIGEWSSGQFNYLTYFLTPYGAQDILMGLLQKIFNFNPFPFFVISFLFRLMASFTLFFIVKLLTKSNIPAFISSVFFAVTFVGLDATNWVFNFPSYISISFWLIFFYLFFKSQYEKMYPNALMAGFFYYSAYIFAPIRMHGLTFFVVLVDLLFLLRNRNFKKIKEVIQRQSIFGLALFLVRTVSTSTGDSSYIFNRLQGGFEIMINSINKSDFSFILNPFIMIGRFIFPESFWIQIGQLTTSQNLFFTILLSAFLFLPFILMFAKLSLLRHKTKYLLSLLLFSFLIWTIIVQILTIKSPSIYTQIHLLGPALIGGYLSIFTFITVAFLNNHKLGTLIFMSYSWIFLSFVIPWVFEPIGVFVSLQLSTTDSVHRYMITPAVGLALYFGFISYLAGTNTKQLGKVLINLLIVTCILIHASLSNNYLTNLAKVRNAEINDQVWKTFSNIDAIKQEVPPIVFYFEGDPQVIYWTLSFGFPTHMGLLYNIKDGWKLPIPLTSDKDLMSAITDGKILSSFAYPEEPLPIEKVYAYYIGSDGFVIDETSNVRKQLHERLEK